MRIIGVIGAAECSDELAKAAEEIGREIARRKLMLVCGGLGGVMEYAAKGAKESGGTVIGVLPVASTDSANPYVTIPIATNMGHARNVIIAHTADMLIAVGGGYGTLSEIAIAKKLGKRVLGYKSWQIDGVENTDELRKILDNLNDKRRP